MFEVLPTGVRVIFDNFIVLKSSLDFLWKLLFTLRSLIFVPNQPCLLLMQLDLSLAVVIYCFLFNISKKLLFVLRHCFAFIFHAVVVVANAVANFHIIKYGFSPVAFLDKQLDL